MRKYPSTYDHESLQNGPVCGKKYLRLIKFRIGIKIHPGPIVGTQAGNGLE
jgi:hypothetical protein